MDRVYPGDLEADADLVGFADTERLDFRAQTDYNDSELGSCRFAIRVFDGDTRFTGTARETTAP